MNKRAGFRTGSGGGSSTPPTLAQILALFTADDQIFIGTGAGTGELASLISEIYENFTADQQIFSGTGNGTGEVIDLLLALGEYFAANQVLLGTGAGTAALTDFLSAVKLQFTADNQLLAGTGVGTGELITATALIEEQFTADQQIFSGTGAGTGELIDLLTALGEYYADDQVFQGTGAGTGAMTNPTSGYGLKADSMEELAPAVSLTTLEGDQGGSTVPLPVGSYTTTNSVTLVPGTYLVLAVAGVLGQTSAGAILHQIAVGTATATGAPALPRAVNTWNAITTAGEALPLQTIVMIVTCTVGGTLLQNIKPPTGMTGSIVAGAATNLVAVQIA